MVTNEAFKRKGREGFRKGTQGKTLGVTLREPSRPLRLGILRFGALPHGRATAPHCAGLIINRPLPQAVLTLVHPQ